MSHLEPKDVPGIVMLERADPERVRAEAHAAACPGCAAELAAAHAALAPLAALQAVPAPSADRLEAIRRAIVGAPVPTRARWTAALLAVFVAAAAAAIFRGFADAPLAWVTGVLALGLGVVAIVSVKDEASGRTATAVAGAAALGIAMLAIEPGSAMEWEHGGYCAGTQLLGALAPALGALVLARGQKPSAWAALGRGAGGALVALSALMLVCPAHSATHVAVFHVLSVAAAALCSSAVATSVAPRLA